MTEQIEKAADNYLMEKLQPYINMALEFWIKNKTLILVAGIVLIGLIFFFGVLRAKYNRDNRRNNKR
ncbi:MAG: hypothetical protein RR357_01580 [Clostridia bacterium]